jgi:hypothetical protein
VGAAWSYKDVEAKEKEEKENRSRSATNRFIDYT